MASERQIAANRKNAQRSTGPRDTSKTRLNALQHGLLSRETLITSGEGAEDGDQLDGLRDTLRREIAPKGALEEILTDKLVMVVWRWRRLLRYETAAIRERSDAATFQWEQELAAKSRGRGGGSLDMMATDELEGYEAELRADVRALKEADPVLLKPDLWPEVLATAEEEFGVDVSRVLGLEGKWRSYEEFEDGQVRRVVGAACEKAGVAEMEFRRRLRARIAANLEDVRSALGRRDMALDRHRLGSTMPAGEEWERGIRYEAHLSRQFFRALHELERLQGARLGMDVKLPVAVDVVGDGDGDV